MSIFKTIGKIGKGALAILAPTLAGALPGPLGAIAKQKVTELLGLDNTADDAAIEAAIAAANPELRIKLQELDNEFKLEMERLGVDVLKLDVEDRRSARERHMAVKDKTPGYLAWTIVLATLAMEAYLMRYMVPDVNREMVYRMLGMMDSAMLSVLYFYFGSSAGSKQKTEAMASKMNGG